MKIIKASFVSKNFSKLLLRQSSKGAKVWKDCKITKNPSRILDIATT